MSRPFWSQAAAVAGRDLVRERRNGEVLWITIPFGVVALLLVPLAVGTDAPLLRAIGPGLFWVIVMLFGVLVAVRQANTDTPAQRDAAALLGLDPAAGFTGRTVATFVLLLAFEIVVGLAAIAFYDIPLSGWLWAILVFPLIAIGLALLGTLAGSIVSNTSAGTALVPFLVAPLAVPLLLGATQVFEGLRLGHSILGWILLVLIVDLVLAIVGVLTARPLQETR